MRRREFIAVLGSAAAWPFAARAQQTSACGASACSWTRRADDPELQARLAAFLQGLQQAGLDRSAATCGSTSAGAAGDAATLAQICGGIGRARAGRYSGRWQRDRGALQQATRTVPIVFAIVRDPVGAGFVDSLARPGGNATGFTSVRIRLERQMAGAAQGDRAARDARGGHSGSSIRPPGSASSAPSRPWRRRWGGVEPGRRARRRRDRARHHRTSRASRMAA